MIIKEIYKHIHSFNSSVELLEDGALKVEPTSLIEIAKELNSNKKLDFDYLMCVTSYDIGNSNEYGCAYNFYSNTHKHYVEIRVEINSEEEIPSLTSIWKTADWHEREAYDMMGVIFSGHPDMKRILLSDDWEGHPLRKDYKEPDYYRGVPVPKDKTAWE